MCLSAVVYYCCILWTFTNFHFVIASSFKRSDIGCVKKIVYYFPTCRHKKNWKKHLGILSFYTFPPLMTIIWCMVPEIWSMTGIIFCHSGPFFPFYTPNGSWDMEWNRRNFFVILNCFLPFYPPNNTKNQNFEKMKKPPGDIIILHRCNINDNHINDNHINDNQM